MQNVWFRLNHWQTNLANVPHDAPQFNCTCGIYATKNLDHLRRSQYWQYGSIHGEVFIWGSVVEHEQGFRAEFAYPKTLYLSPETLPVAVKEIQNRMEGLIPYSCDFFIAQKGSRIPLWGKGSGLDAAGLEFLMDWEGDGTNGAKTTELSRWATALLCLVVALRWSSKCAASACELFCGTGKCCGFSARRFHGTNRTCDGKQNLSEAHLSKSYRLYCASSE